MMVEDDGCRNRLKLLVWSSIVEHGHWPSYQDKSIRLEGPMFRGRNFLSCDCKIVLGRVVGYVRRTRRYLDLAGQ